MWRWTLCVALLALTGCTTPTPRSSPSPAPPSPATPPAAPTVAEAPPARPPERQPEPPGFTWTSQPSLENVPSNRLVGYAGGRVFQPRAVVIERGARGWTLIVANRPLPSPGAPLNEGEFVSIDLPTAPTAGREMRSDLRPGGGFWRLLDPDDATSTSSWHAPSAWALRLTRWQARPYDRAGTPPQVVGSAAGRVAICFKGSRSLPNAWLAGTFSEAVVRYVVAPSL